jgi:hypothetical protein
MTQNFVTPFVSLVCNFHLKIYNLIKFYTAYFISSLVPSLQFQANIVNISLPSLKKLENKLRFI